MTKIHSVIHDRRIDVSAPPDLPDGTEVVLTVRQVSVNDAPMTPQEIERVLAAMQGFEPLDIPEEVASDLDAWESRLNQHGIDRSQKVSESQ